MTSRDRIEEVFRGEIPDRVPLMELGINEPVQRGFGISGDLTEAQKFLGLDFLLIWAGEGSEPNEPIGGKREVDKFGRIFSTEGHFYITGALETASDLDRFTPEINAEALVGESFREKIRENSEHPFLFMFHGPLELAYESMGIEKFSLALYDDPAFVRELFARRTDYFIAIARRGVEIGCEYVMIGDDAGFKTAPLMSPKDFERFVIPCYGRIIKALHVPVLWHSDGNVWELLPMIRDVGIKGVHPMEPIAGMNMRKVRKAFPEFVVMGNVDCGEVLCRGTLEDVRREVDRCMSDRYILGSSNSLHDAVKPENAVEMFRYAREAGVYGKAWGVNSTSPSA